MSVKIKAALPKDERDGLQSLTRPLVGDPDQFIVAVCILRPTNVTENLRDEDDPHTVTCKVAQIEPLNAAAAIDATELLNRAFEGRTGLAPLPFDQLLDES